MDVTLNMKFLEHCEPGELVRAHFGLKVEWGIVADRQQQKRVVVISGNNAPWYLDLQGAVLSCLSYGREYDLLPEYGGPCVVFTGSFPAIEPGTLVYACPAGGRGTTDRYLIARATGRAASAGPLISLNLNQFNLGGEPGDNRAGFKRWSIWMRLPPDPDHPMKVCEYDQENPQEH